VDAAVSGSSTGGHQHEATPPPSSASIASSDQTLRYHQASSSSISHPTDNVIPMPTLYNDSHDTTDGRPRHGQQNQPRLGTIEVLLYNMASMWAGVAVEYDVRLTNVSPIHPKLYTKRSVLCKKTCLPKMVFKPMPAVPHGLLRTTFGCFFLEAILIFGGIFWEKMGNCELLAAEFWGKL
jgi:hypothetical protein